MSNYYRTILNVVDVAETATDSQLPDKTGLQFDFDPVIANKIVEDTSLGDTRATSIEGSSGNTYSLSQGASAQKPLWDSTNNQLIFDGVDDRLSGTITSINTNTCSLLFTAKNSITSGIEIIGSVYSSGSQDTPYINGVEFGFIDGKATLWYGDGTNQEILQESIATGHDSLAVFEFSSDGTTRSLYKNATLLAEKTTDYSLNVDTLQLGARGSAQFGNTTIENFCGYNVFKTDAQAKVIRQAIISRFIGDTTSPVLSNVTTLVTGATTAKVDVDTTEKYGQLYWIVSTNSTAPSVSQITQGKDSTGTTADDYGQTGVLQAGTQTIFSEGLTTDATYYFYGYHEDGAGNGSNIIQSTSFVPTSVDSDAQAIIDQMEIAGSALSQDYKDGINELVRSMKYLPTTKTDLWGKTDAIWITRAAEQAHAKIEWKNPAGTQISPGSHAFNADQGWEANGTSLIDLGWNPTSDGVHFKAEDAFLFAEILNYTALKDQHYVGVASGGFVDIQAYDDNSELIAGSLNYNTAKNQSAFGIHAPSYMAFAHGNGYLNSFSNKRESDQDTATSANSELPNGSLALYGRGAVNDLFASSGVKVPIVIVGAEITESEFDDLVTIINQFKQTAKAYIDEAPVIANSALTFNEVTTDSATINFNEATDDYTDASALTYSLYQASSGTDISTVALMQSNGTVVETLSGVDNFEVSGLTDGTTYEYNIIVSDGTNEVAYTQKALTTKVIDNTAPTVSNSVLSFPNTQASSITVSFTKATDNVSSTANIMYELYRASSGTDLSTLAAIDSNGTKVAFDFDVNSFDDTNLDQATTYEYNVVVTDEAGNRAIYQQNSDTTIDNSVTTDVVIDSTKVNSNLTGFQTYVDLADMPQTFWDKVTSDGGDIRTFDSSQSPLYREVVSIDTTAKTGELWIRGDLSSTTDTTIHITVDGTSTEPVSGDPQYSEGVWDQGIVAHDLVADSSPSNQSLASGSLTPTANAGKIGAGAVFSGSTFKITATGYKGILADNPRRISLWMKTTDAGDRVIAQWGGSGSGGKFVFRTDLNSSGSYSLRVEVSGGYIVGTTPVDDGVFHHVAAVLPAGSSDVTDIQLYVDGQLETVDSSSGQAINTVSDIDLFIHQQLAGTFDEFILSADVSADWINASYVNQNNPSNFYSVI